MQTPGVHVFENSSLRCIGEANERRRSRNAFQNRVTKPFHGREFDIGMQSTLSVFRSETWTLNKKAVQNETSILELYQEGVTALVHHEPQVCAVGDQLLPESNKEQVKEPPQPTQQELMEKASQEAGFSYTIDIGQFFRTRPLCNTHGKWVVPLCREFTRPSSIEGSRILGNILARSQTGRLRGSMSDVQINPSTNGIIGGRY